MNFVGFEFNFKAIQISGGGLTTTSSFSIFNNSPHLTLTNMNFRTSERSKVLGEFRKDKQSQAVYKKNSVMISSQNKPSSASSSSSSPLRIDSFFKPEKPKRQAESIHLPSKRVKSEDITSQYEAATHSDDEDMQPPLRTKFTLPTRNAGKQVNPFKRPDPNPFRKPDPNPFRKSKTGVLDELDDTDDFRESSRQVLKMPKKKADTKLAQELQEDREKEQLLNSLKRAQKKHENEADKKKCPYCGEVLYPLTPAITNALKEMEKKDEAHKQRELKQLQKENSTSMFSSSTNMIRKRQVPWAEKDAFCRVHHIELVIKPDGESEGYPTHINFDEIEKRMQKFDEELKLVIRKQLLSDYRDIAEQAYKEEGVTKARSTLSVMSRFQKSLPGYYGPKGAAVILGVLNKMYLTTGYLDKHLVSQQLPLEFLQQVLVPEVGFRLILQDIIKEHLKTTQKPMSNSKEKAKKIMLESIEYGSALFPTEDAKIEDAHIEKPLQFIDDDDSEEEEQDPFA